MTKVLENIPMKELHLMTRMNFIWMHIMFESIGLYPGQNTLLIMLEKQQGVSQKDLAEQLYISTATLSTMLKRLEKHQYIRRIPDVHDRRVMRLFLTEQGKTINLTISDIFQKMEEIYFNDFLQSEIILFKQYCYRIASNIEVSIKNKPNSALNCNHFFERMNKECHN